MILLISILSQRRVTENMAKSMMKSSTVLRNLLKKPGTLFVPGCFNAMSARVLMKAGFPAVYMTGYGTSLSLLGLPDAGYATMCEMQLNARYIANAVPGACYCCCILLLAHPTACTPTLWAEQAFQ